MKSAVNKRLISKRFSRSQTSYEQVTPVQEEMTEQLANLTQARLNGRAPNRILELGCGTGRLTRKLRNLWPKAEIHVNDISPDLVAQLVRKHPELKPYPGDAEYLATELSPIFDLVISNATVQWFAHPLDTLQAWFNRLNRQGILAFGTFGPQTFHELKDSFASAYAELNLPLREHVLTMVPIEVWKQTFPQCRIEVGQRILLFPNVRSFLRSIQKAGATHAPPSPTPATLHRKLYRLMTEQYTHRFGDPESKIIPATYETVYATIEKG